MLSFYLQWLNQHQFHGIRPGLVRIINLLKKLNNPHTRYPTIHIAGTNGKGSTSAILSYILTKHGLKTGLYTSPHLFSLNERFKINNEDITDEELSELLKTIHRYAQKEKITYFEITTALAFLYFYHKEVDIAIIETGMGGRLDATNVIHPLLSIITTIGFDHTKYLGSTLERIAFEKAGIIKRGKPVVIGNLPEEALSVVLERSRLLQSRSYLYNRDFKIEEEGNKWNYWGDRNFRSLELSLRGFYQGHNLALALKASEICVDQEIFNIEENLLREALASVKWEGRFKRIDAYNRSFIIDGAHNLEGVKTLKDSLLREGFNAFLLIFGATNEDGDKPLKIILEELAPLATEIYLCEFSSPRKVVSINEWLEILKGDPLLSKVSLYREVERALMDAMKSSNTNIVITGSLYFLSEVIKRGQSLGLWT